MPCDQNIESVCHSVDTCVQPPKAIMDMRPPKHTSYRQHLADHLYLSYSPSDQIGEDARLAWRLAVGTGPKSWEDVVRRDWNLRAPQGEFTKAPTSRKSLI